MEGAAFEVQWLATLAGALLSSAEGTEVFGCLRDNISTELQIRKMRERLEKNGGKYSCGCS